MTREREHNSTQDFNRRRNNVDVIKEGRGDNVWRRSDDLCFQQVDSHVQRGERIHHLLCLV